MVCRCVWVLIMFIFSVLVARYLAFFGRFLFLERNMAILTNWWAFLFSIRNLLERQLAIRLLILVGIFFITWRHLFNLGMSKSKIKLLFLIQLKWLEWLSILVQVWLSEFNLVHTLRFIRLLQIQLVDRHILLKYLGTCFDQLALLSLPLIDFINLSHSECLLNIFPIRWVIVIMYKRAHFPHLTEAVTCACFLS